MVNAGLEYIVNVQEKRGREDEGLEAWVFKQWKYSTVEWLLREREILRSCKSSFVSTYPVNERVARREKAPPTDIGRSFYFLFFYFTYNCPGDQDGCIRANTLTFTPDKNVTVPSS